MLVCSCGEVCHVETFLHMTDFSTFLRITHFAPNLSCGELSLCDRFSSHFSCGETSPHDNLSYGKISPHDRFFSTSTACGACDKYQVCARCPRVPDYSLPISWFLDSFICPSPSFKISVRQGWEVCLWSLNWTHFISGHLLNSYWMKKLRGVIIAWIWILCFLRMVFDPILTRTWWLTHCVEPPSPTWLDPPSRSLNITC